ncbi:hypothetical protein [Hirschia litorea]|uniref:Uncharacterized protein n=1 Tax=Hirschia litorea TaxID=1199156 RepID=A0ABW2IN52_9PROT
MKKVSYSLILGAFLAMGSTACAAEKDENPPAETQEAAPKTSGFNFSIPGDDSAAKKASGFNFSDPNEVEAGKTALGRVDIPVDDTSKIETFEPEIQIPEGNDATLD